MAVTTDTTFADVISIFIKQSICAEAAGRTPTGWG
jgi:hypothetical protein